MSDSTQIGLEMGQGTQRRRRRIISAIVALIAVLLPARPLAFLGLHQVHRLVSFRPQNSYGSRSSARSLTLRASEGDELPEVDEETGYLEDDGEWEDVISEADAVEAEKEGYVIDDNALTEEDRALPAPVGATKYFGATKVEGVSLFASPSSTEEVERLMPGDVVAAQVPSGGTFARLLDGRGWVNIEGPDSGVEEVHPWAARVMKRPGISKNDAAALAYLSMDESKMTPLAEHLPLPGRVISELQRRGVKKASPIQEAVFSDLYRGKSLCLQSQTGSGKTLAMTLPLLTAMSEESEWGPDGDKIIIVASCRELAVQLFADVDSLGFYPKGKGYTTMIVVGNVPPVSSILKANVIIGTPNELGGYLHKDNEIIKSLHVKLRGLILDEVDDYTSAPKLFGSKWKIKRKRKKYNEQKMTLSNKLGDFDTGKIEWFIKRALAYSRRKDFQVLAASATLSRNIARKVYRLLRWDPLGRWYNKPPPLMRPLAAMKADWQAIPRMPTIPLDVQHRFVQVVKSHSDVAISDKHWTRKPYEDGGLPRLKLHAVSGQRRGMGGRPVSKANAASMMDALYDTLKCRKPGSALLIICRTAGLTVRDTVEMLHSWGFHEAEALHEALWGDPKDWPSRWAIKYSYDMEDHAVDLAQKHADINARLRSGVPEELPVGGPQWKQVEERKKNGEAVSPLLVGFEGAGRGLHLDGIETVYILGMTRTPAAYLHLAGRVGRLGQKSGKVVSIVPKRVSKVFKSWIRQIGPNVTFEPEPITRIRSKKVIDDGSAVIRSREERWLTKARKRKEKLQKMFPPALDTRAVKLLPEPEEQTFLPVPGFDDMELFRDLEPARSDRVTQAASFSRQRLEIASRKMAAQMQRATLKWPGPPAIPKHVTKFQLRMKDKEEKAKRRLD